MAVKQIAETIATENKRRENGAPGESRTPDLLVRSQTLYPAELRARSGANAVKIDYDTRERSSTQRNGAGAEIVVVAAWR